MWEKPVWGKSCIDVIERLKRSDKSLRHIRLRCESDIDKSLPVILHCLMHGESKIVHLDLRENRLTDEIGVQIARFVSISTALITLDLSRNRFGEKTFLALAAALRINTSLKYLYTYDNSVYNQSMTCNAFIDSLRINPMRPRDSRWILYDTQVWYRGDFARLQTYADERGHPTLQMLLADRC